MRSLVVFMFSALLLTGCGDSGAHPTTDSAVNEPSTQTPSTEAPAGPDMTSESSCDDDYPLVLDPATRSVVATAQVSNDGDEAGRARVTVQWFPVGSDPIKARKVIRIEPGGTVRVPFRVKPGQSAMNGMVGLKHGDEMCRVDVKVVP